MKKRFLYITVSFMMFAVFSCNNEFLNDNIDQKDILSGDSQIIITPSWDTDDYQFFCINAGNADFTVENAPDWLEVETKKGKLTAIQNNTALYQHSVGTIRCKAKVNPKFEKTGLYLDNIQISVNGKTCYVPVMYVSEGNPQINVNTSLVIDYNYNYNSYLTIQNTGEGILLWNIVSMPEWLTVDMNSLNISNAILSQGGSYNLPLILVANSVITGNLKGTIILKTNDKNKPEIEISVTVDLGNPEINLWLYNNQIDFGLTATTNSFDISVWGSGILVWHFEELPEWLTINPSYGIYRTHTSYGNIILTCDRTKLQPGLNSSVIYLKSNAYNNPSIAITVTARAPGDNTNIRALEGNIVDVAYNKDKNMLCYAISQPNKIVVYDVAARAVLREIALSKVPTCLAVSEDFTKMAVGHGGEISAVDLTSYTVSKTIEISNVVYDIAWAQNSLFCYTVEAIYSYYLSWVDTDSGTNTAINDNNIYGKTLIKKVPTQSFAIATRRAISPSGFFVYDILAKSLKSYSHMDLSDFWFSEDGKYTFGINGNIYRTSGATGSNDTFDAAVNSIGQLQIPTGYFIPGGVEHSISAYKIWAIAYSDTYYYPGTPSIYQFNDNDFTFQKSFFYSDVYKPDAQTGAYEVRAYYLFSNSAGTELSVLRKGVNNNNWSIEFIKTTD